MKNIPFKIFFLIFIILNMGIFSITGKTSALFNNNLAIDNNLFSAGVLEMTLRSGQTNFVLNAESMQPGQQVNRDIYVGKTADSASLQHQVSYEFISGSSDLCDQLKLEIWYNHYHDSVSGGYDNRDMRLKYNGQLTSLVDLTNVDFIVPYLDDQFDTNPNDGTEQWFFYSLTLPENISSELEGKTCHFNLVFEGWQTNIPHYGEGGFTDEKKIESTITGHWTPELNSIGDKSGVEGELIEFTVGATDPNSDSLTYSASNLPTGAIFNPSTRVFQWTLAGGEAGTYSNVHFEVSDGQYVDSEDITITVTEMSPPTITGVASSEITTNSAKITWETNQSATSKLEYGPTSDYGTILEDSNPVTSHSISIDSLTASTTYHYRVSSKNASEKESISGDYSFSTLD
jgi:hypothetical protein